MVSGGESWDGLVYKARDYISTRYNINSFSLFIIQGTPPVSLTFIIVSRRSILRKKRRTGSVQQFLFRHTLWDQGQVGKDDLTNRITL